MNCLQPLIGSSDVETPQDAKRMIDQTNVDGVMIGRVALGNAKIRNMIKTMETADELTNIMNGFADEMMQREQVAVGVNAV
jgi:tRNA-dihydrouridine synthase